MSLVSPEGLLEALRWRYAVKAFDVARHIPEEIWSSLEETLVLTPSSFGLQPWRFLVLTDPALRERLLSHSWGQRQVVDCSHYVVFCGRRSLGASDLETYIDRIREVRGTPPEKLAGLRRMLTGALLEGPFRPVISEWSSRQVYIALGNFMTAAALLGIDTCPMEGFESPRYDEVLGLNSGPFTSVVCCAAGYRSAGDRYATLPKVRFPRQDLIERR